jgi:hypothetical protein
MPLYQAGTLVVYQGNEYKALVTTYGLDVYTPGSTPTVWQLIGACGTGAPVQTAIKSVAAGPNVSQNFQPVKFFIQLNQATQVTVDIYTPMGQKVAGTTFYGNQGMNNWLWDIQNASKHLVSSGLYVYAVRVAGNGHEEVKTGKIVIVH